MTKELVAVEIVFFFLNTFLIDSNKYESETDIDFYGSFSFSAVTGFGNNI